MTLSKETADKILRVCLETGGDFAKIFAKNTFHNSLELSGGEVSKTSSSNVYGAGVRILHNTKIYK